MKNCKKCASANSRVTEVRIHDALPVRRRQCMECSFKWKTVEVEYWEYMHLIEGR